MPNWVKKICLANADKVDDVRNGNWAKIVVMDPPTLLWQNKVDTSSCYGVDKGGFNSGDGQTTSNYFDASNRSSSQQ